MYNELYKYATTIIAIGILLTIQVHIAIRDRATMVVANLI